LFYAVFGDMEACLSNRLSLKSPMLMTNVSSTDSWPPS